MVKNLQTQRVTAPTAFVTKGRQRVKQYDNNIVYLKNGDEFEVELFNPTSNKVLAKISLNGNPISSGGGIVVRPGERVFLERYLTDAKKFLFQTYEVDAKDPNVQEAIKLNGVVDIEFYDEYKEPYVYHEPVIYHYHHYHPWYQPYTPPYPTWTYYGSTAQGGTVNYSNSISCTTNANNNASFTSGIVAAGQACSGFGGKVQDSMFYCSTGDLKSKSVDNKPEFKETGRVEKGSYSDQSFMYDSTTFKSYCDWKYTWKILPDSQKAFVKEDLNVFCSNCGARRRKTSHKFCPNCGQRFN